MRRRNNARVLEALGVRVAKLRGVDLIRESWISIAGNPGRSLVTALGTVLGAAAFVSTLGLSSTLGRQVSAEFDVYRATEVVVRAEDAQVSREWQESEKLGVLRSLNGVQAAGARVSLFERRVQRTAALGGDTASARIVGADPEALKVIQPRLTTGRLPDQFHEETAAKVALLPKTIADKLGVQRTGVAVFVDDQAYSVIGIFDEVERSPEAMISLLVPFRVAEELSFGISADQVDREVLIETAPGAAQYIGRQAPLALHPQSPESLRAIAPPDPMTLRRSVEGNVTKLSLLLSIVALAIGTVSIGNAASASIAARTSEIGLRRAVGARPVHVFAQLLGETTVLGLAGGLAGAFLGATVTVGASLWNGWQPVIDLKQAVLATAVGAAAGLIAGLIPALKAMRIEPVAALQR
ncbi:ABC transporter permease [Micromonospora sp. U21]|uniref:ABC transporter permease n=1 Tax=Micromonospora sp. U21 TaxID=2824899 RepID=UPI001B36F1FD|nr:ABC transporter permease [Micromonospora sp. U21]MBQ0904333.1 ABC transporter permease [Micromonospora sp. U21]